MKKKELVQVEPVKINPLFGMEPGKWLTIAYALALVLIIFLVGIVPDLVHNSRRVRFSSQAYNAAVYVDGTYEGGTPFERKITAGEHTISFQINGIEIDTQTVNVKKGVFFAWLFPRHATVKSEKGLSKEAYESVNKSFLTDVAQYSAILEYDATNPYRPIYTDYAKTIFSYKDATYDVLKASLNFITTKEMYEDAQEALKFLSLTRDFSSDLLATIDCMIQKDGSVTGTVDEELPKVTFKKTTLNAGLFSVDGFTVPWANFSNGRKVNLTYPEVAEAGEITGVDSFNISSICITENMWASFVLANPKWSITNKENLIAEGLVDEYYLCDVTLTQSMVSNRPVRNISYKAAQAFCAWLSEVSGKNVYIPSNDQWTLACLGTEGFQKSLMPTVEANGPSAMMGGLWELTSTYYVPLERLSDDDVQSMLKEYDIQSDMVIKGASYINDPSQYDAYSIGTVSQSLCSDYMGFRIAWN